MRSLRILPVIGAAALALAACTGGSAPADSTASPEATQPAEPTVLNVYAAASLTETFGELEDIFEEANPGVDVRFNFAPRTSSPSSARGRTSTSWPPPTSPP